MSGGEQALENANLNRIGEISVKIREAVRLALPTPAEQFLTVMVPGKVVNLEDYQIDEVNNAILPLKTELSQAILCDDMPCLSTLQMGPTGKSVSRSYANAISKLVSAETTIGIDANSMSDEQKRYEQGMKVLSSELPDKPGLSLVELYTEKQAAYTKAVENKTKAFDDALKRAKDDPMNRSTAQVREAYDKWVDENARTYRNYVQAAYMDWVITGRKEEVEYWFSVVDQDSALARIEQSKEVMRWAVVQDVDGQPSIRKANKCLDKIKLGTNQTKTADWYTWEITRLEKTNAMLKLLKDAPPKLEVDGQAEEELNRRIAAAETTLKDTMAKHIQQRQAYQKALGANDKAGADTALEGYTAAQKALDDAQKSYEELRLAKLSLGNKNAQNKLLQDISDGFAGTKITENETLIKTYQDALATVSTGSDSQGTVDEVAEDLGIPKPIPDPTRPLPPTDFFTPITVEVSASSETKRSESSATSFSAGGSASWGLVSVSAAVSHSQAHSKASSELANSDVKVSFECMRVDITRPWLRPELFYDDDLVPGPGVKISPGFGRLRQLMESPNPTADMEAELAMYSTFPLYPVAFLVACNVVLEISGSTTSLQSYMNSSSTSASLSVGYGPFSVSGSGAHSSSDAGSTCESTASGCRIEIKSPQIIAWVSQMVPALPRLSSSNSKNLVVRLSNLNFAEQWSNDPTHRPDADLRFADQESTEPRRIDTHLTFASLAESQSTTSPRHTSPTREEANQPRQLPRFKSGEPFRDYFSHDKPGEELSHDAMVWRLYRAEADEYDQELVAGRHASLDVLLLFAALFSAILTAFLVESKDLLQQDPADTTATLLLSIAQNQINSSTDPPNPVVLPDFTPTRSALWINGLWFASLSLSLATALVAMLSKEWLTAYTSSRPRPAHTHSLLRQARFDGLNSWSALHIIAFLPTLLHISLLLFAVGLVIYLWTLDVAVAAVTCAVVALTVIFYLGTTLLGAIIPFCPFVTEMSRYLRQSLIAQLGNWFKRHLEPHSVFSDPRRETTSMEDIRAVSWLAENTRDPIVIDCSYQALAGIRIPPEASDSANDAVKQWYKSLDRIFPASLARFVAALQDRRALAATRGANLARHTRALVQLCEFLDTVDRDRASRPETSRVTEPVADTRREGRPRLESFALPSFSDSPPLPPSRQRAELALEALDGAWRDDLPPFSADTFACLTAAELRLVALTASSLPPNNTPDTEPKETSTPDSNPEATIINFSEPPRTQISLATLQNTYHRSLVRGSIQLRYHADGRTPISPFALITLLDALRTAAACATLNLEDQTGLKTNTKKDTILAFLVPVFSFEHYIRLTDLPRGPIGAIIRVLGMSVLHPHSSRTVSSVYKHIGFQVRLSAARAIAVLAPVLLKQWISLRVSRSGDGAIPPETATVPDLQAWPRIEPNLDAARLESAIMVQLLTIIQTIGPHIERAGALALAELTLAEMNRISKLVPYSAFMAVRRHVAETFVPLLEYAIKDRKGNETHVPLSDAAKTHVLHLLTFEIFGNIRRHHLAAQFIPLMLRVTQDLPYEVPLVRAVLKYVVDRVRDTRNSLEYLQLFTHSDQGYAALESIGRVHENYIELVVGAILQITHISMSGGPGPRHDNAVMDTSAIHGFLDAIRLVARHTTQVGNKQGHRHLHAFGRNVAYILHRIEPEAARIVLEHGALDEMIDALQVQYERSRSDLSLHKGKTKHGKGDAASSEHLLAQIHTLKNERLRELSSQSAHSREEGHAEGSGRHSG